MGERCWQYLDEFDYPVETLANYAAVARAFPLNERRALPFTYHQSTAKHPDRFALLDRALAEGWDRKQLREAAGLKRSSPLRFTVAQLREKAAEWPTATTEIPVGAPKGVQWFLDWLSVPSEVPE